MIHICAEIVESHIVLLRSMPSSFLFSLVYDTILHSVSFFDLSYFLVVQSFNIVRFRILRVFLLVRDWRGVDGTDVTEFCFLPPFRFLHIFGERGTFFD